jgi:TolA-binding protein
MARGRDLRGLAYHRQKNYDPAVQDFQAYLGGNPSGDEVHDARYALVLCRIGQGQFDEATKELGALLEAKADYEHADKMYYELGHGLLQKKESAKAAEAFRTLAEKLPDSPLAAESWFHVGRHHEQSAEPLEDETQKGAEWGKAAEAYVAAAAKAKGTELGEKSQYKLGDVQFRLEEYAKAAATLQQQVADYPSGSLVGPGRFLAAESLYRLGDFQNALPLFVQVADAKVERYDAQALYRAGSCAGKLNNWPESQKHFAALIAQFADFPQLSEARYGLGLALQNQQKLPEARQLYEQVTAETETETAAKARFMVGEIDFAEKKYEDAVENYLQVAVGYPYEEWQALARFEAGRCFIELGKKDQARSSLQAVVDQFPNHPKAKDAALLIQELK